MGPVLRQEEVPHSFTDQFELPQVSEGNVVLCCGTYHVKALQDLGVVQKGRKVGSLRGHKFQLPSGGNAMATFDPGLAFMDYARKPEIQWDTRLACRLARTGSLDPELGDYRYVEDFSEAITAIKA